MFNLFKQHRRKRLRSQSFPPAWLDIIKENVPIFNRLPHADQRELQGHIQVFLAEKCFEGCGRLELTEEIKVTIAAQGVPAAPAPGDRLLSPPDHDPGVSPCVCRQER